MTKFCNRRHVLRAAAGTFVGLTTLSAGSAFGRSLPKFPLVRTDAEWRRILNPPAYRVLRKGATENRYTSPLLTEHRKGIFACAGCDNPLFDSPTKFESGTGWPSFWRARKGAVVTHVDRSLNMERNEVLCARCGGHLGHLFRDGPRPTGYRYCMNGVALAFKPA
ncbi:MAG: peptide-methionine (R)-S-oxide reductase MsrB [Sphingomicrobium sp.]